MRGCIVDRKDELESILWVTRIIKWVLDRAIDRQQQLEVDKVRLELEDTKKFEIMIHDKIQELEIERDDLNSAREKEVLANEVDTLNCVLDHLFKLRPIGDETETVEIAMGV